MNTHYNMGGMIPIKDVKRNPEWKDEYLEHITTKLVNVYKSCRKRAYKGCCFDYSANNRTKVKMVVGWSAPQILRSTQKYSENCIAVPETAPQKHKLCIIYNKVMK